MAMHTYKKIFEVLETFLNSAHLLAHVEFLVMQTQMSSKPSRPPVVPAWTGVDLTSGACHYVTESVGAHLQAVAAKLSSFSLKMTG